MAQTEGQGGRGTQEAEGQAGQEEGNQVNNGLDTIICMYVTDGTDRTSSVPSSVLHLYVD